MGRPVASVATCRAQVTPITPPSTAATATMGQRGWENYLVELQSDFHDSLPAFSVDAKNGSTEAAAVSLTWAW